MFFDRNYPDPKPKRVILSIQLGDLVKNMRNALLNGSTRVLYTVVEVSEMFGISTKSVYRLLARGLLKSSSALRHKRISKASIDEFVATTATSGGAR